MGKKRRTFNIEFKKKAVYLYLWDGMGCKAVGKELGIDHTTVLRWVRHFEAEGLKGLEEKRGKTQGSTIGHPSTYPEDTETKIKRLEAENEMLKKLLQV